MKMHGTGASNGIAVAKVLVLKEEIIKISDTKIAEKDIVSEIKKIDNAISEVKKNLEQLIEETKKNIGEEQAKIFGAHLEILQDPELYEQIKNLITNNKLNAVKAVDETVNGFYQTFMAIEDPYFRERAVDLMDVRGKIIRNLLGIKEILLNNIKEETIIVAHDLTPSQTSQLNPKYIKGFLCDIGGRTSHSAIMARSLSIPAIVGLKDITKKIKDKEVVAFDGNTGEVEVNLSATQIKSWKLKEEQFKELEKQLLFYKGKPTKTKDNYEFVLEANIGSSKDLPGVLENDAQGIGLFRTEFLYMDNTAFPDEEQQFKAYQEVLAGIKHKVVIRTLDIGGDKELSYWDLPKEMNPFLGYRAIRLCLDRKDIFKVQIRALLRASVAGELAIMFPMVATVEEFKEAKQFVLDCQKELIKEGKKVASNIKIGMMIEIPSSAVNADIFAQYADFFSIGTNDLIQYTFAADRMSEKVSYLYQPYNPAILRLIKLTIDGAKSNKNKKILVGMCGEMAGDHIAVPLLVGLGLDEFSMSASSILATRKLISELNKKDMEILAAKALQCQTSEQVKELVEKAIKNSNKV